VGVRVDIGVEPLGVSPCGEQGHGEVVVAGVCGSLGDELLDAAIGRVEPDAEITMSACEGIISQPVWAVPLGAEVVGVICGPVQVEVVEGVIVLKQGWRCAPVVTVRGEQGGFIS
jgi:hypothetical protein